MKFKAVAALGALAVGASAQTSIPPAVQQSVLLVLATALPTDSVSYALASQSAFASAIASSLSAGNTPAWYQALPSDVKSLLPIVYQINATPTPSASASGSATPASTSTVVTSSAASTAKGGSSSVYVKTASQSASASKSAGASASASASVSAAQSTGAAAAFPTAAVGAGVGAALGFLGMLAL